MKNVLFYILIVGIPSLTNGQGLSADRVKKIKQATVRITIDSVPSMGTGFFVDNSGLILTNWHVVQPAFVDAEKRMRKLYAETENHEKYEVAIAAMLLLSPEEQGSAVARDYCILTFTKNVGKNFHFLKMGTSQNLVEGDEVYTCGFPLGMERQFISKGIVSTKYTNDSIYLYDRNEKKTYFTREEILLDITLNKGNSGGAVMKVGKENDEDVVVGISDFIITPMGNSAQGLQQYLSDTTVGFQIAGVNPLAIMSFFTDVLDHTSVGVSGAIAIDHAKEALDRARVWRPRQKR